MSTDNCTTVGPMSPEVRSDHGGGGSSNQLLKKATPLSLDLTSNTLPILLITANVGSIFDDPENLIPQWLTQVTVQIKVQNPAFVAIHCQEVCAHEMSKLLDQAFV